MTPRDRKAARRLYTDAKIATARAAQALADGEPAERDALARLHANATAAEAVAWGTYLAAIHDAPAMDLLTEPEPE